MFAFGFNPFMINYHFIPPSRRQYCCGFGNFGMFGMGMPFMNASLFQYNMPYINYTSPFNMSFFNPFGFNYGFNFGINYNINYDSLFSSTTSTKSDEKTNGTKKDEKIDNNKEKGESTPVNPHNVSNDVKSNAKKLGPQFLEKVKVLAQKLNCNYQDLIAVMISESGLNPAVSNKRTNATGLIQFMPDTAKSLGTTVEQLKKMSGEEQLAFVEKYLKTQKQAAGFSDNHKLSAGELYALVFLPARANRQVLCQRGEKNNEGKKLNYYEYNKGLDTNKDGKITKTELDNRILSKRISDSIFS